MGAFSSSQQKTAGPAIRDRRLAHSYTTDVRIMPATMMPIPIQPVAVGIDDLVYNSLTEAHIQLFLRGLFVLSADRKKD